VADDDDIAQSVGRHGWHAISVAESEFSPSFVYTIGLCQTAMHPDAIVFGLDHDVAYSILAKLAANVRAGEAYSSPGVFGDLAPDLSVATRPVHVTQHPVYLGYAMGFYRHVGASEALRAIQLFWPDKAGLFPFDVGCDSHVAHLQPRLELPELRPHERRW
jgi:hypothetical protein